MSIWNKIKTMDKRFSWSFIGTLIGIIGIGYGVYADFFKEEKPRLIFDILSNTQILDLKEDVSELQIHYKNQDLKKSKKSLVLLTLRVTNKGNAPIKEVDYFSKTPFGFKIEGGRIAEPPSLINASRKFFSNNISLRTDSLNNVFIDKIPIDCGEYFTVKILTICNNDKLPRISPFGEISGLRGKIDVLNSFKSESEEEINFWDKLTNGSFGIHFARFFYYILCIALVGIFIGVPSTKISEYFENRRQKKTIAKYKKAVKVKLTDYSETIFNIYRKYGESQIQWLHKILNDKNLLDDYLVYLENRKKENLLMSDFLSDRPKYLEDFEIEKSQFFGSVYSILETLTEKGIIDLKNNNSVDSGFNSELEEFKYYLDLK